MSYRCLILAGLLAGATLFAEDPKPAAADPKPGLTMADVIKGVEPLNNTELAIKDFWNRSKGLKVTWEGVVVEVEGGRNKAEIQFACYEFQTYRGYNVVVTTFDQGAAAKLKKGTKVSFTAVLNNYKAKRGNPVIIYLSEGSAFTPVAAPAAP